MNDKGRQRLWGWFGLSYAGFLTLPRVLMHEMPDEWQDKMAALLEDFEETFPNQPDIGVTLRATQRGKLVKFPESLTNYRYPRYDEINAMRASNESKVQE